MHYTILKSKNQNIFNYFFNNEKLAFYILNKMYKSKM